MELGTHKEQTRDRKTAMAKAFDVDVTKRDFSTWWECEACNSHSNLNWLELKAIRNTMNAEPQCLWATG
eukprot:12958161-Heterocapsa_arctica.AAC.1